MADVNHQIVEATSRVNALAIGAELDAVQSAILSDIDNRELWERLDALKRAYRDALLPPWSIKWRSVWAIPKQLKFRDLDRRANVNALRRKVRAAERALARAQDCHRGISVREHIRAEVALTSAKDALAIYRQWPAMLPREDLQTVIGA